MNYLLYCLLGIIEQFLAILYYKTASKNLDFSCAIIDLMRGAIWLFVISALIDNIHQNIPLGIAYIIGGSIGDYLSLKAEPWIGKRLLKIKNHGRKKKRWFLQGEQKQ
jgi:hypothetical protein